MSAKLSEHVREEIDQWAAKFPPDRKRSAVISALHAVQHENHGFLTTDLMDAVAEYLGLPNIFVYEVASFIPCSRPSRWGAITFRCARIFLACCAARKRSWITSRRNSASRPARARRTGAFI